MKRFLLAVAVSFSPALAIADSAPQVASALAKCRPLPAAIEVLNRAAACGRAPAVRLSGRWKNSFSAAFRWDDGSTSGEDRSPFDLDNPSASSSPYKTQRRIRKKKKDILCYGKFLTGRYPLPEQLTIKRTVAPSVKRFCVSFEESDVRAKPRRR